MGLSAVRPVDQTDLSAASGNCWAACIASILELAGAEVPNLGLDADWLGATLRWLLERGYTGLYYGPYATPGAPVLIPGPSCYHIASGDSPRYESVMHAVVAYGEDIVHDPHPSRAGLAGKVLDRFVILPAGVVRPGR